MPEAKVLRVPDYTPSPRQILFHTSPVYETLYGGAAGGGKTTALCGEAITLALLHPGYKVFYFRRAYPDLEISTLPEMMKQLGEAIEAGVVRYNGSSHTFTFQNGSTIRLAHCEQPNDVNNYRSADWQCLIVDELTLWPEEIYSFLKTRTRPNTTYPDYPIVIKAATNPGGVGHAWVKERFIDPAPPEEIYIDDELQKKLLKNGETPELSRYLSSRIFIPAKVSDNPDATFVSIYRASLEATPDENLKRALLDGDWHQFEGQAFTEFKANKDGKGWHVVAPFSIPAHWPKWMSYDWGYGSWAAALWFARDPETKKIYVYREIYVHQMALSEQADLILSYDRLEGIRQRLADPSLWKQPASAETGETIAQVFAKHKVFFQQANNNRASGKMAVHEALATAPDGMTPNLMIFQSCPNLVRTLPYLPYDPHNPEDVDTKAEDHGYDCLRYGLMNQLMSSIKKARRQQKYDPVTGRLLS